MSLVIGTTDRSISPVPEEVVGAVAATGGGVGGGGGAEMAAMPALSLDEDDEAMEINFGDNKVPAKTFAKMKEKITRFSSCGFLNFLRLN